MIGTSSVRAQDVVLDAFDGELNANWFPVDTNLLPGGVPAPWGPGIYGLNGNALHLQTSGPVPLLDPPMAEPCACFFDTFESGFLALGWGPSAVDPMFSNGFIRARVRADQDSNVDLLLRTDPQTFSGYVFSGVGSFDEFHFARFDKGVLQRYEPIHGLTFREHEEWMMEFGAVGDQLSLKAWQTNEPEPSQPQLTFVDRTYDSGIIGVSASVSTNKMPAATRVSSFVDDVVFRPSGPIVHAVSPGVYRGVEAPNRNGIVSSLRYQQVHSANDFTHVPGSHWITGIAFRPDAAGSSPPTLVIDDVDVSLSLSERDGRSLSNVFDENVGPSPIQVYRGPVNLTSTNTSRDDGSMEFDQIIKFQKPFLYDPSDGNLITEIRIAEPLSTAIYSDGFGTPSVSMLQTDPNATHGQRTVGGLVMQFDLVAAIPGDLNADSYVTADDLFLLGDVVLGNESAAEWHDLNSNGTVDAGDAVYWVKQIKSTWIGDANLDGQFDSGDMVAIFASGQYHDQVFGNADWTTGDFNFDGEFDSSDLVVAFADGGFEQGLVARKIPEPVVGGALLPLAMMLLRRVGVWQRFAEIGKPGIW